MRLAAGQPNIVSIRMLDADGAPVTGIADLTAYGYLGNGAPAVQSTGNGIEKSSSEMPGLYALAINPQTLTSAAPEELVLRFKSDSDAGGSVAVYRTFEVYKPENEGIDQQSVRDAMLLAVSGGSPATDSIDDKLDKIPAGVRDIDNSAPPVSGSLGDDIRRTQTSTANTEIVTTQTFSQMPSDDRRCAGEGDTAKNLDQVSAGSGLTAQETRDAMKLAPTAGAPASNSIDDLLDDIITTGGDGPWTTGSGGGGMLTVEAEEVSDKRSWVVTENGEGHVAPQSVTVQPGFAGTLAMDFTNTTVGVISSNPTIEITGPATVTPTSPRVRSRDLKAAFFDVAALTEVGSYIVKVTVQTSDQQTIPVVGLLEVRDG